MSYFTKLCVVSLSDMVIEVEEVYIRIGENFKTELTLFEHLMAYLLPYEVEKTWIAV